MSNHFTMSGVSHKGGVGKTTIIANLGGVLADLKKRVLLIDCDPTANLSSYYKIDHKAQQGLIQVIESASIHPEHISKTNIENLDIIIQNDLNESLRRIILHKHYDGRSRLWRGLQDLEGYDYVLIDTQGAPGPIQDIGVVAADLLVTPLRPEAMSTKEFFRGTKTILDRLGAEKTSHLSRIPMRVVINGMKRTNDSRQVADFVVSEIENSDMGTTDFAQQVRDNLTDRNRLTVSDVYIPDAKAYPEATTAMQPVHRHEPTTRARTPSGNEIMHQLLWDLVPQLKGQRVER